MKAEGNRQQVNGRIRNPEFGIQNSEFTIQNPKSKIHNCVVVLGILLVLVEIGCGYHFSGRGEGFPKDVKTVYVASFVNRSRDIGIEGVLASALRSEFRRQGQLRVVNQVDQADAILSGVVRSFDSRVVSVNREDEVLQYEITLVTDLRT